MHLVSSITKQTVRILVPYCRPDMSYHQGEDGAEDAAAAQAKKKQRQQQQQKRPFPPKHYVASLADMESVEYPLATASESGEPVCPEGYVATRPGAPFRPAAAPCLTPTCNRHPCLADEESPCFNMR